MYSVKLYGIVLKRSLLWFNICVERKPLLGQSSSSTSSGFEFVHRNGLSLIWLLNFFNSEVGGKSRKRPQSFSDSSFISGPFYGNFQPHSLCHCSVLRVLKATRRLSELIFVFFFAFVVVFTAT